VAVLDCNALATAGKLVQIYSTFFTAENISDLSNLDGTVHVITAGDWNTTSAFWDGSFGACLDANGGSVKFVGSKPVNGDPCGTSLAIKECFPDGSAQTTVKKRQQQHGYVLHGLQGRLAERHDVEPSVRLRDPL
jgi:hypothetical protein